jgi:hypothetical protein
MWCRSFGIWTYFNRREANFSDELHLECEGKKTVDLKQIKQMELSLTEMSLQGHSFKGQDQKFRFRPEKFELYLVSTFSQKVGFSTYREEMKAPCQK